MSSQPSGGSRTNTSLTEVRDGPVSSHSTSNDYIPAPPSTTEVVDGTVPSCSGSESTTGTALFPTLESTPANGLPQSPIRRVVRAANARRRRLKLASADAFTFDALQKGLKIFRDPSKTQPAPTSTGNTPTATAQNQPAPSVSTSSVPQQSTTTRPSSHNPQPNSALPPLSPSEIRPRSMSAVQSQSNRSQHTHSHSRTRPLSHPHTSSRMSKPKRRQQRKSVPIPQPQSPTSGSPSSAPFNQTTSTNKSIPPIGSIPPLSIVSSTHSPSLSAAFNNRRPPTHPVTSSNMQSSCNSKMCDTAPLVTSENVNSTPGSNQNMSLDLSPLQDVQPQLPRLNSRRRDELRQMLLSFPEHDATTVSKLLSHFKGDHDRVHAKLAQARAAQQQQQSDPQRQQKKNAKQSTETSVRKLQPPPPPPPTPEAARFRERRSPQHENKVSGDFSKFEFLTPSAPQAWGTEPDGPRSVGIKRRRASSRDEDSIGADLFDGTAFQFGATQMTQDFPKSPYFGDKDNKSDLVPESRTKLRSQIRRARITGEGLRTGQTSDFHLENNRLIFELGLPNEQPRGVGDVFGDSSGDDLQKSELTHESDTTTTASYSSKSERSNSASSSVVVREDKSSTDAEAWKQVYVFEKLVAELEHRVVELEDGNRRTRQQVYKRVDAAMREMSTIEKRHDGLTIEVEDNLIRVGKTEQYLDAMRRDLLLIVGERQWAVWRFVRAGVNNSLYYLLAYLVPVLAFVVRIIRDVVLGIRRRRGTNRPQISGTKRITLE